MQGIGVDADQGYLGEHILTSALKKVDVAVFNAIKRVQDGKFKGGTDVIHNVANDGVGLGELNDGRPEIRRPGQGDPGPDRERRDQGHPGHRQVGELPPALFEPSRQLRLELRGITKRFGPVFANDRVDFDLRNGEVQALLGENGAGKSTLMSILYGLYHPDAGEIRIDGEKVTIESPSDAIERGIGMVHQHFMLVPVMTVTENIVLGGEPRGRAGLFDVKEGARRVRELSQRYGLAVDPDAAIEDVSVGMQQRVEILKALYRDARILVLDEPTAVLTAQETAELFKVLRSLKEHGVAIVFISHKLTEVLAIADRVTVLRRGRKVDTVPAEGATEESLARLMVGRDVLLRVDKPDASPHEPALEVEDLWVRRRPRSRGCARPVAHGPPG